MRARAVLYLFFALGACFAAEEEVGKIMRPPPKAAFPAGAEVDIVATAPKGKLQLDGQSVTTEQPFPDVFHSVVKPPPGAHTLALVWDGGHKEVAIFVGPGAPAGFEPFRQHPPLAGVQCTQCHELTRRGRFHFKGGCFDCHQQQSFAKIHTHDANVLAECGLCHNAHGSTAKAHLLYTKEAACKLCHN
jgi:predicted CXXCH cytochrome family protein